MTAEKSHPVLEFVPGFPQRQTLLKAFSRWWRDTCWFVRHTITPTETLLPDPARSIAQPADLAAPADLKERLAAAKGIVDAAEARLNTVRAKAINLLGFVALVIPLVSWWLLSGRAHLAAAPVALEVAGYVLMLVSAAFLSLSLLALVRSQGVVSYPCQTPDLFVDFEKGELKSHDWAGELRGQALAWGAVQRWSDVVTDFFRAGQRFLVLSLLTAVIAGGISYLYPQPTKPVSLVQKATGEVVLVGDATGGVIDPNSRWVAALWNLLSFIVGGGIAFLAAWLSFRRRWRPIVTGPERKDVVKLTAAAAEQVRKRRSPSDGQYLRVKAQIMSSGLPDRRLEFDGNVDAATDCLSESEGVQIVVARDSADLLKGVVIEWDEGKGGFFFSQQQNQAVALT
jgi:Fe-S cluster assembly iron-binding protein IscA